MAQPGVHFISARVGTIAKQGMHDGRIAVTAWPGGDRTVRIGDAWALLTAGEAWRLRLALERPYFD